MVDEAKIEKIQRECEDLFARMRRPEQGEAMDRLMRASGDDIRRALDAYYDSPEGQTAFGNSPQFWARTAVARRAAIATMEDKAAADAWLVTPIGSLGDTTPMSRLNSDEGLRTVLRVLASIEHGLPP